MLHEFLESKRSDIIARTQFKVAARTVPHGIAAELTSGVPRFLDHLIESSKGPARHAERSAATKSGAELLLAELLLAGFTIGQVIHGYGNLGQAVTELAFELDAKLSLDDLRTLNRCLDSAVADAVTAYGRTPVEKMRPRA